MSVVRRGGKWCIRYYGPEGRQRWETIGPNRRQAETVLHQRQHEALTGVYPILRRRRRLTFAEFAEEIRIERSSELDLPTCSVTKRSPDQSTSVR